MVTMDLTDVTLVSDDTKRGLDWCDSGEQRGLLETWLMWLWWVNMPSRDLAELVILDTLRRLDWCESGAWGCLLETWLMWFWWVKMRVVYWWKLSIDECCPLGEGGWKKTEKKLKNVSLVCMYVGRKSEMSVFFLFFPPTVVIYRLFQWSVRKKKQKNVSFYVVCMYVRPKLTFVSFFFCFFCPPSP